MQRIAVPMIGGTVSSTVLTLVVTPALYGIVKGWQLPRSTDSKAMHELEQANLGSAPRNDRSVR